MLQGRCSLVWLDDEPDRAGVAPGLIRKTEMASATQFPDTSSAGGEPLLGWKYMVKAEVILTSPHVWESCKRFATVCRWPTSSRCSRFDLDDLVDETLK